MPKYLIVLDEKANEDILNDYDIISCESLPYLKTILIAYMDNEEANSLRENPLIKSVEHDGEDEVDAIDTRHDSATLTDAFKHMNIDKFHEEGITGSGFKVAVMDTGMQPHINLKVAGGVNAYNSAVPWNADLVSNHGTQVAGVINAQGVNNDLLGIAPDADLYCIRIDDGTGGLNRTTWSSQIAGINWAVANGMDAVNCSFSSLIDSSARKEAFRLASEAGIAIFCSGGNTQPSGDTTSFTVPYPAKYPFCIGNANIMSNKVRNWNSCIGRGLNFATVATSVRLTTRDTSVATSGKYTTGTGTSMAAPANMGIYILYRQKYGEGKEKTLQRMAVNAEDLGSPYWYGAGLPKYPTKNYLNVQVRG